VSIQFLTQKAVNFFLAGSAILLFASCLPTPAPTNGPKTSAYEELTSAFTVTPDSSANEESTSTSPPGKLPTPFSSATQITHTATPFSYGETNSAFTATPGSFPNEESTSTSPPGELPGPIPYATQTFPAPTSNNAPTSDQGWSSYYGGDIAFWYPGHWIKSYIDEWGYDFYQYVKDPEKDIGVIFNNYYWKDDPTHLLAQWAEDGMDVPGLLSFKPETVVDGGNIEISGIQSSTLTAQGNGMTAQATYLRFKQTGKMTGLVWYAPSDQWDAVGEIFSEILASMVFMYTYLPDFASIHLTVPTNWPEPARHPDGEGVWFQSADHKIGMLVGMIPKKDPLTPLADWIPERLSNLGFLNCNGTLPGDQIKTGGDSIQGTCLDRSGVEVTYEMLYITYGSFYSCETRGFEVVTYFPSKQSEYSSWIVNLMFESMGSEYCGPE
jgi:hypothetical protein